MAKWVSRTMITESATARTLELFVDEEITYERALEIAAKIPLRATFQSRKFYAHREGRKFGPYRAWYAYWRQGKRPIQRYIGGTQKKRQIDAAHKLLQHMIDQATAAALKLPQVARLLELQRLSGAKEDDDLVAVVHVVGEAK